jgi:ribosome maturation protein Sdo1
MDEDVEIMSEDEEKGAAASEDSLHLKPKTKDKKQVIYIILARVHLWKFFLQRVTKILQQ